MKMRDFLQILIGALIGLAIWFLTVYLKEEKTHQEQVEQIQQYLGESKLEI